MGSFDNVVFGKKKFANILEEIYDNQTNKSKQIAGLISELKPLVKDIGDATLIVPRNKVEKVKDLVAWLDKKNHKELL